MVKTGADEPHKVSDLASALKVDPVLLGKSFLIINILAM